MSNRIDPMSNFSYNLMTICSTFQGFYKVTPKQNIFAIDKYSNYCRKLLNRSYVASVNFFLPPIHSKYSKKTFR